MLIFCDSRKASLHSLLLIVVVWSALLSGSGVRAEDFYSSELGAWVRLVKWRDNGSHEFLTLTNAALPSKVAARLPVKERRFKNSPSGTDKLDEGWPDGYYAPALQIISLSDNSPLKTNTKCKSESDSYVDFTMGYYDSQSVSDTIRTADDLACKNILPLRPGDILKFNNEFDTPTAIPTVRFKRDVISYSDFKFLNDGFLFKFYNGKTTHSDAEKADLKQYGLLPDDYHEIVRIVHSTKEMLFAIKEEWQEKYEIQFSLARPVEDNHSGGIEFQGISGNGVPYFGRAQLQLLPTNRYRDTMPFEVINPWSRAEYEKIWRKNTPKSSSVSAYELIFGAIAVGAGALAVNAAVEGFNDGVHGCKHIIVDKYVIIGNQEDCGALTCTKFPSCDTGYVLSNRSGDTVGYCVKTEKVCQK